MIEDLALSTLDSTSTDADVIAAYDDAVSWYEDNSTTKAKALVTAGAMLLRRRAKRTSFGGEEIELDLDKIADEVNRARRFVNSRKTAAAGGAGVTYIDTSDLRG